MFKLNLNIALRNIWRNKLTTSIKLIGLIVGLSTVVVLVSYVMFELSYDQHNENVDQIYRLQSENRKDQKLKIDLPSGLAYMLVNEFPEVSEGTMMRSKEVQVIVGDHFFKQQLLSAENSFFKIFTAPLIIGDINKILKEPHTIVLSESFAKTAFPKGNAVGQLIRLVNNTEVYQIVGIIKDLPKASHFRADLITREGAQKLSWTAFAPVPQYIKLKKGVSPYAFEKKLRSVYAKYNFPKDIKITLMPLSKIHLYSHTANELDTNSDIKYIYIFSIIAFFILLIAIVNFVNLTIAASIKRGKEIGMKKVMGASTRQLRVQFLSESYLYFIFAALLVLILTHDLIPFIGAKIGLDISLYNVFNFKTALIALAIVIIAGFIAGLYPAIILSRLMPVKTLKGYTGHIVGSFGFKKVLMMFQFAISAFLIICTLAIYTQLNFIRDKNLGFDQEQVLVSGFNRFGNNYGSFKEELQRTVGVKSVSMSGFEPGKIGGGVIFKKDKDTTTYKVDFIGADLNFLNTLNIKLLKGRGFSSKFGSDLVDYDKFWDLPENEFAKIETERPILLNEAAVKAFNLKNPTDTLLNDGIRGKVIGVVSDFNSMSLHEKVNPIAIKLVLNRDAGNLYIKLDGGNVALTKERIEQLWKKYFPAIPPNLQFLDAHIEKLYQSEMRLGSIFISFAGIAIFLCCMGLFGMVYFEVEQRTKEIAIRKILGASIKDLLALLNSSFIKIVILANLLVWPVAYYLVKEWLNGFYYRTDLSYMPFAIAFVVCLLITLITVSIQAINAIKKSPVKALKCE